MVFPYVSKSRFKNEIPWTAEDFEVDPTEWETLLDNVLADESERVERFAGGPFETRQITDAVLDGTGTDELPLPNTPLNDVTSLTIRNDDGTDVTIAAANVYVYDSYLKLAEGAALSEFTPGPQTVMVSYSYGRASTTESDIPRLVQEGVIRLARSRLGMIEEDGVRQESRGDASFTYRPPEDLRKAVASSVRAYRPDSYSGGIEVI